MEDAPAKLGSKADTTRPGLESLLDPETRDKVKAKESETRQALEQLQQLKRSTSPKEAAARRVEFIKRRLEALKQTIQLMEATGDRKAAAGAARELARLAKELGAAARDYAGAGGGATASPQVAAEPTAGTAAPAGVATGDDGTAEAAKVQADAQSLARQAAAGTGAATNPAPGPDPETADADGAGKAEAADTPAAESTGNPTSQLSPQEQLARQQREERARDQAFAADVRKTLDEIKALFIRLSRIARRDASEEEIREMDAVTRDMADAARTVQAATAPMVAQPGLSVDVMA